MRRFSSDTRPGDVRLLGAHPLKYQRSATEEENCTRCYHNTGHNRSKLPVIATSHKSQPNRNISGKGGNTTEPKTHNQKQNIPV